MKRVQVNPDLIQWARQRGGYTVAALTGRFPRLPEWESGRVFPTLKQLQAFARATHAPIGYLFLSQPPEEHVPIPDLRTVAGRSVRARPRRQARFLFFYRRATPYG
jgi:transcriptional regulator with XRE-family HTH domain